MHTRLLFSASLLCLLSIAGSSLISHAAVPEALLPRQAAPYPDDLLTRIRNASTSIPGELATRINMAKLAESHRTYAAIIEGGSDETFISARTAFQVIFPKGSVMLDSGMDQEVHQYYGFGRDEPYWPQVNDEVQEALRQAQRIVISHEHGDHIAGVIRSDYRDELAAKTLLTKNQVRTLTFSAQLPQIAVTPAQARDYLIVDYELLLPVAPGIVLVKAPGHTPGHQMIYVKLSSGLEYLFIGDIGWSLDNITDLKSRPTATAIRIKEDPEALMHQMIWIKAVMTEEGIIIVPSHDDRLLQRYVADSILGDSLTLE